MSNGKKVVVAGQEELSDATDQAVCRQSITDDMLESVTVGESHEAGTFEKDVIGTEEAATNAAVDLNVMEESKKA